MNETCKHPKFAKADALVVKIFKYISIPPAFLMVIVALLATVNVITSKLFHVVVPSCNDWITYLLIPIVFLSIGHVHLDRGLVVVDFVNKHYPKWLLDVIDIISNVLLIALNGFLGYRAFVLMVQKYQIKEFSSVDAGHFYMWPFCLLLGFGMVCFAFTSFWCILRTINNYHPNVQVSPEELSKQMEAELAEGKERNGDAE